MTARYTSPPSIWSLGSTYSVHDDRIEIATPLLSWGVPFEDLRLAAVRPPFVALDLLRGDHGLQRTPRALKIDLADLREHVAVDLRKGFFRQLRITPDDPSAFVEALMAALSAWRAARA